MPLFEFECRNCHARIERLFPFADAADRATVYCDACIDGRKTITRVSVMRRVPSASNFALKGAGFHANDYPKGH